MKKNTLEDYKEAIKAKYEEEKSGDYASFLINPSRAKLRDLCIILFTENSTSDDLRIFRNFFGFDFRDGISTELKKQTDKFRPLETFFKGETDLTDISGIDLAAILVRYNKRPIHRFLKLTDNTIVLEEKTSYSIVDKNVNFNFEEDKENRTAVVIPNNPIKKTFLPRLSLQQFQQQTISVPQFFKALVLLMVVLASFYGIKELFFPAKDCMQWSNDHYELVDCSSSVQGISSRNEIIPIKKEELDLKKIKVTQQTPFFQNNKAIVWYCKKNDKIEYFSASGFHPENGKPLKPISQYIIDKYIEVDF
jgi:hypothetical protein